LLPPRGGAEGVLESRWWQGDAGKGATLLLCWLGRGHGRLGCAGHCGAG